MTFLWIVTGVSLVVALVAWRQARRTARRLEQVTQMYWELKYQQGALRVQVQRVTPPGATPSSPAPTAPGQPGPGDSFVSLASLKR